MTRAPWNDHIVEPGTDPVMPTYLVEYREKGEGTWRLLHDEDWTPVVYMEESLAEDAVAMYRQKRTDDDEPTPYEYRVRRVFE